ncbi:MAG: hypothetical protein JO345_04205 [Streptosporangiaceae bacterium]|nr:hypothetical protein [Streptosporangiaceae bacterium]
MRVPHVSDRIKEAPAVALRGVLAGVGQLLLVTDKLRNKAPADDVPQARTPAASETVPEPASSAATATATAAPEAAAPAEAPEASVAAEVTEAPEAETPKRRDLNKTGNVRLIAETGTEPDTPAAEAPEATEATADEPAALPLANYDELSVASLRARLRNLTAAQVTVLAEYERSHAGRPEVVTMFERRIAKLEAGG